MKPYAIAEFHHADDAHFCDMARALMPDLISVVKNTNVDFIISCFLWALNDLNITELQKSEYKKFGGAKVQEMVREKLKIAQRNVPMRLVWSNWKTVPVHIPHSMQAYADEVRLGKLD